VSDAVPGNDWATTKGSPAGSGVLAELFPRPAPQRGRAAPVLLDIAVGLASVGNRAYTIAVVAYVYEVDRSASAVALAASARYLAGLAASLAAFAVVERVAPKRLLVAANGAAAVALIAGALAIANDSGIATVIAFSALARALTSVLPPANAALLPTTLGGRDLAAAAARQNSIDKVALFAGPAVGAVLLLLVSPATEMAIVAALFVVAAAVSSLLPRSSGPLAGAARTTRVAPQRVPRHAVWFGAFCVGAGLVYGGDTVLFNVLARDRFHLGASGYGLLFAGLGAGGLLASAAARRVAARRHLGPALVGAAVLYTLPTAVVPLLSGLGAALPVEAARGVGALLLDVAAVAGLQRIVLPRRAPFVIAAVTAGVSASVAAGALMVPPLLSALGLDGTLLLTALVPSALAVAALGRLRSIDIALAARAAALASRTAVLGSLGLLAGTSRPTLELLAAGLDELRVPSGTVVVREGDVSDELYAVVDGEVGVFAGRGEAARFITSLGAASWFGEIAALTGAPRTATVVTSRASTLFRIEAESFREALENVPPSPSLLDGAAARLSVVLSSADTR
jgi:hypothetical protein